MVLRSEEKQKAYSVDAFMVLEGHDRQTEKMIIVWE